MAISQSVEGIKASAQASQPEPQSVSIMRTVRSGQVRTVRAQGQGSGQRQSVSQCQGQSVRPGQGCQPAVSPAANQSVSQPGFRQQVRSGQSVRVNQSVNSRGAEQWGQARGLKIGPSPATRPANARRSAQV
jgi:septum formation inhibitor MinC